MPKGKKCICFLLRHQKHKKFEANESTQANLQTFLSESNPCSKQDGLETVGRFEFFVAIDVVFGL